MIEQSANVLQVDPSKLRTARKTARLSRSQMAYILGCTEAQVSNLENGWGTITSDDLAKWCRACEVGNPMHLYTEAPPGAFSRRKKS